MIQIAIDGPSGSGKSSVAKALAEKLGITYLDTGAMYRAATLFMIETQTPLNDQDLVKQKLEDIDLQMEDNHTILNGRDVSSEIRQPVIDQNVSLISSYSFVRTKMVECQQLIAGKRSIVLDGRDIATVVLPKADFKFFITASPEVRANRRILDYKKNGVLATDTEVLNDILRRDHLDSTRETSPLAIPIDAQLIDTSFMTFDEVVDTLIEIIKEAGHGTDIH